MEKTLHNSDVSGARENVADLEVVGNGDMFRLLCKVSSQSEGWMKSTKAMETPQGCLVQVTTQQRNPDGFYSVAEALSFVPGVRIGEDMNDGRQLVDNGLGFTDAPPRVEEMKPEDQDRPSAPETPQLDEEEAEVAALSPSRSRVTLASIKDKIDTIEYHRPVVCPHMTVAFVRMSNGFVVTGESAPADPENFNALIGRKIAFEDALRKVWALEGYQLRTRMELRERLKP